MWTESDNSIRHDTEAFNFDILYNILELTASLF